MPGRTVAVVSNLEAHPDEGVDVGVDVGAGVTLLEPREVPLGGPRALLVHRTLPHRDIRTIGAWCFVDHYGPTPGGPGMHLPPHPHVGLQTVTWLLAGDVEHRDSVGSRQLVHPGELNLMTAGRGIAHSEDAVSPAPELHGVQLWTALPEADRHQEPHFEHHADLPVLTTEGVSVTVFVGELDGARSDAAAYSPLLGAEVTLAAGARAELPLDTEFEHGVLAVDGEPAAAGVRIPVSALVHLEPGRRSLLLDGPGRVLVLGGTPFEEDLLMWWNFVGRSHDEIVQARQDWEAGRAFGVVDHPAARLLAPALPTTRLRARPNRRGPRP
jgi:redox-sensitive bicupin YhaK (pirin superfamily)